MSRFPLHVLLIGVLGLGCGCSDKGSSGEEDAGATTTDDQDTGTTTDAGGDSDEDIDADAGADSDTDSDTDTDFETDKAWTPDFDTDPGEDQSDDTWTIMMYEDADNNLENVLLDDVNEMELADIPSNVNVIVLIDRARGYDASDGNWKGAKLFRILHDETAKQINSERLADPDFLGLTDDSQNGEEIDMGSPETVEGFIDFCQANFPADHYILHFSDHGDGWKYTIGPPIQLSPDRGMCSDDSSGNTLSISQDLPAAIEGKGLEAITLDACSMGTVEVAWALAPHTDYTALSVMTVPGTGWEYTDTLNTWFEHMSAKNWALVAVQEYKNYYTGQFNVGYTALDLTKMGAFSDALDDFVAATDGIPTEALVPIRNKSYRPDQLTGLAMRDVTNFVRRAEAHVGGEVVDGVLESFSEMILYYWHTNSLGKLRGLTIYAPGPGFMQGGPYMKVYNNTPFAQDSTWDEFVLSLL